MLVPWSWLTQWVDPGMRPEELVDRLAFTGLEVEAVESTDHSWDNIVVGEIQSIEPHPNADKLVVCAVSTGDAEPRQIVCGADNMSAGDHVPVALPGARLGEMKVKKSKLRGVVSEGMMCSPRELGLGDDHAGLMILDPATPVGAPAGDVIGGGDTVLELSITPNRGDCLSIRGLAREVAILAGTWVTPPEITVWEEGPEITDLTSVTLDDPEGCPRYTCRVMQGVAVGPSPPWLADVIAACGLRPINNVVDATNYVMLELGQPLHAFDLDKLAEGRIVVRRARAGETVTALDETECTMNREMTAICDADRIVAVAGVMGGVDSAVTERTTNLLLESAYFDPTRIRRTERQLKLSSDSSYRFVRDVDIDTVPVAVDRLAQLIQQTAGGTVARGRIDAYPAPRTRDAVRFRLARIPRILGITVDEATVRGQLESLGCAVAGGGETLDVTPPPWRADLTREIDLIEEVARLTGYDKIPTTWPTGPTGKLHDGEEIDEDDKEKIKATAGPDERVTDLLVGAGYTQLLPFRFGPADDAARLRFPEGHPAHEGIRIVNPLTEDRSVMRTELFPSLLRVAGDNQRNGQTDLSVFELGPVFVRTANPDDSEPNFLGGLLAGRRTRGGWATADQPADISDAKGALELVLDALQLGNVSWDEGAQPYFKPGAQAVVTVRDAVVGWVGEFTPEVLEAFDAQAPMFGFLMNFDEVIKLVDSRAADGVRYIPFSRFPPVLRVRTYDVPEATLAGDLTAVLEQAGREMLDAVELTDVYRGEQLPAGIKSLTFGLTFRAADRTLRDAEVETAMQRLDKAAARCGATVREA